MTSTARILANDPHPHAGRHIALFLPTLHGGGAERVFMDLAQAFIENGHTVDLVLMSTVDSRPLSQLVPSGVRTVDLGCQRLWTSGRALTRYLLTTRPFALVAAMPLANAIAAYAKKAARVPLRLVLTEHNARSLVFGDVDRFQHRLLCPPIRFSYRYADRIVAVSQGVAERLKQLPGLRPEQLSVVYNPAYSPSIHQHARAPAPHRWLADKSIPTILGAGRLERQKDFETLIRAFALVRAQRSARLLILGGGSQHERLKGLIESLNLRDCIELEGFVMNPWAYMVRANVFVLSSIHEGLGNVLIEAMAFGVPVVSTDCPAGPREILQGGAYGPLVPVQSPGALAAAITTTLDQPIAGSVLRERAAFFSLERAVTGYMQAMGLGEMNRS